MSARRIGASLVLAALLALAAGSLARGEVNQQGALRVAFEGNFSPQKLPRHHPAPVKVRVEGSIGTADGSPPPRLRRVSFAVNRHGRISTRGLPSCRVGLLQSTTTKEALKRCRSALVGHGQFDAFLEFPGSPPIHVREKVLAFNGSSGRRRAILLHLFVREPTNVTLVLPFTISHRGDGDFGTVLTARIPSLAGNIGYVSKISMKVGRTYTVDGRRRSLFSASCAAPSGFDGTVFNFARGSFEFAGGRRVTTTLTRLCRVR
jgi:hypothetical protein